ncbi:MAG TPA: hypothetical protein VKF59_02295 [Candidatus Dormibacteraeota bacterium]|nr:hypothetical protein [Candidatus Dormibacteraeota bacterium]
MTLNVADERKLTELNPASRNRYYYGKLMDVLHFTMEQRYVLSKEWLYNRMVLGPGVVCGLGVEPVTTAAGSGVVVRAGLAIDGWGREIIVPRDVAIVPLALTDQCGASVPGGPLPARVMVQVCYLECDTDWGPALVGDPDCGGGRCEAGTVVESYCMRVVAGSGPAVTEPCLPDVLKGLQSGSLHAVLCELTRSCPADPDDPCLTLANVTVAANGTVQAVDACGPRLVAPTNRLLMQLVSCLADCCASGTPPPPAVMQVVGVRVLERGSQPATTPNLRVLGELAPPSPTISVKSDPAPEIVEVSFTAGVPYDPASVVLQQTLRMNLPSGLDSIVHMPATNSVRLYRQRGFRRGHYEFELVGGPEGPVASPPPAIRAQDGTRLDGEFPAAGGPGWHSGEGVEGGSFKFIVNVS